MEIKKNEPVKMEDNSQRRIIVIILSGEKEPEKAIFGLSFALAAASSGCSVTIFLGMSAAVLAKPDLSNKVLVEKYHPIPYYFEMLNEFKVDICICSTCIDLVCNTEEDSGNGENKMINSPSSFLKPKMLREGVKPIGVISLIALCREAETVVF